VGAAGFDEQRLIEERKTGLGGSDIVHLMGIAPYGCARRLWYDKGGVEPDHPFVGNQATLRGQRLEEFIVSEYVTVTGREVRRVPMRRHKEDKHLIVHCDRMIVNDPRGPGYLEAKCPGRDSFYKQKRNGLHDGYILQMQHGLLVTGWTWGSFALFNPESFELIHFDVEADAKIQDSIRAHAMREWAALKNDMTSLMPPRLNINSRACERCPWRTKCQGQAILDAIDQYKQVNAMAANMATAAGVELPLEEDPTLQPVVDAYVEAKTLHDDAEAYMDECKEKLQQEMGGREEARVVGARVYYRAQTSNRIDSAALKKEHPDIAKKFTRQSVSRPLRVFTT
jgi:predicted phage-related endonuclease